MIMLAMTALTLQVAQAYESKASDTTRAGVSQETHGSHFFVGLSGGLPQLIGLRCDVSLQNMPDLRPDFLLTVEMGSVIPYYVPTLNSVVGRSYSYYLYTAAEARLGNSPFYTGVGFAYSEVYFPNLASEEWIQGWSYRAHAAVLSLAYRTSYRRSAAWCFSLGVMIAPYVDRRPVYPLVKIGLTSANLNR